MKQNILQLTRIIEISIKVIIKKKREDVLLRVLFVRPNFWVCGGVKFYPPHTHKCARENGKIEFFNITCGDYEFQTTCEGYRNKTFVRAGVWARDSYTIIADISVD